MPTCPVPICREPTCPGRTSAVRTSVTPGSSAQTCPAPTSSGAYLKKAHLDRVQARGAVLRGCTLIRTDLTGADLTGADLSRSFLVKTWLDGADLRSANLTEADLYLVYAAGSAWGDNQVTGAAGTVVDVEDGVRVDGVPQSVRRLLEAWALAGARVTAHTSGSDLPPEPVRRWAPGIERRVVTLRRCRARGQRWCFSGTGASPDARCAR